MYIWGEKVLFFVCFDFIFSALYFLRDEEGERERESASQACASIKLSGRKVG